MEETDSPYDAVFHFRNAHLCDVFMGAIPEAPLRERLKRSESLRSRTFPGFRITKALPTDRQMTAAFRKEIVDRRNGELASFLCALWIRKHSFLAKDALLLLGVEAKTPEDARSWIDAVHHSLEQSSWVNLIKTTVRSLADRYLIEEIQIFISIIGYGKNQEHLHAAVLEELDGVAADPTIRKKNILDVREAERAEVERLETLKPKLQHQLEEERRQAATELDDLNKEHERIASAVAQWEKSIDDLNSELERIREDKNKAKESYDASIRKLKSTAKAISARRDRLSVQEANIQAQLQANQESHRSILLKSPHSMSN